MYYVEQRAVGRLVVGLLLAGCGSGIAADAAAEDQVQVYGLIGTYVGSMKRSDNVARTVQIGSGGLNTSYWGFRGGEDLGNGLSAIFQLESFFQPDTGGAGRNASDPTGFSRSGWVGLKGDFGQLTLGRMMSPFYASMQIVNPFQASVVFSPLVVQSYVASFNNTIIGDTVWNNAIQYVTPQMGDLSVTAIYAPGEVAGDSAVSNYGLHLRYQHGPLAAVLSAQRFRSSAVAPSTGQYAYLTGFSYDFGPVKLYGSAQATDSAVTAIKSHTYQAGVSVPVTTTSSLQFSWARTNVDNPKAATGIRNTAGLGYDYFLSRRTDIYVNYLYDHVAGHEVGNSYALGIRHLF
ncbi:Outer membrane protein (porin) [Collimonas sp. OK607]|uniref:porin n=1 Tax=Collimonas sp. OK607 TaxID=1798194 RepID=UPI0008E86544|nr:porin [Collimonas sp. OK607]SFA68768.1 Outer membrane protein (porin) [Collimonas sp. OK607]